MSVAAIAWRLLSHCLATGVFAELLAGNGFQQICHNVIWVQFLQKHSDDTLNSRHWGSVTLVCPMSISYLNRRPGSKVNFLTVFKGDKWLGMVGFWTTKVVRKISPDQRNIGYWDYSLMFKSGSLSTQKLFTNKIQNYIIFGIVCFRLKILCRRMSLTRAS
jgi:hypothetical protein